MEDLIKQLSEVSEENPAFDGLVYKLDRALNSDFESETLGEDEFDISWDE